MRFIQIPRKIDVLTNSLSDYSDKSDLVCEMIANSMTHVASPAPSLSLPKMTGLEDLAPASS
jgi:hypothetical protein